MSIVIDIGDLYVRCGLSGDETPLQSLIIPYDGQYIPAVLDSKLPPHFQLENAALSYEEKCKLQHHLLEDPIISELSVIYTSDRNLLTLLDRIQSVLVKQLSTLLVSPTTSKYVTIIVEPAFTSTLYKHQIQRILSHKLGLKLHIWIPEPVAETIAANSTNATVIHLGWLATVISTVVDLRVISQKELTNDFCGQSLHYKFVEVLLRESSEFRTLVPSLKQHELFAAIQRFFQSVAYVDFDSNNVELNFSVGNFLHNMGKHFHDIVKNGLQLTKLAENIAHIIKSSALDLRSLMRSNIIILGGLSKIPGIKQYILKVIETKLTESRCIVSFGLWSGASMYSSLLTKTELKSLLSRT